MKIILFRPLIPQNTGNIIRTCAALGAKLILVHPLGFSLCERRLRRAQLDYRDKIKIEEIEDLSCYLEKATFPFYFFSSKACQNFFSVSYPKDSALIFGNEETGLLPDFHLRWPSQFVKIPMKENIRCLNLANSVAIGAYEMARQLFGSFQLK